MHGHTFKSRVRVISVFIVFVTIILVGRLYFVQIVHGDDFSERADNQYARPQGGLYDRGSIYFTDKDDKKISAATLASGFTLAINPGVIGNLSETYEKINSVVTIDKDSFFLRAGKEDDPYEELAVRLSKKQADALDALGLSGVGLYKDRWRYYPGDDLASQSLGFVAFKGDSLLGRYGVERYYDDVLSRGENDLYVNFFAEVFSNVTEVVSEKEFGGMGDVVTSIEPSVQTFLEKKLSEVSKDWNSKSSGGVIIDPKSGEIFALGVNPSFDLNTFNEVRDNSIFTNPIIERVYEMGSIIKPLTMAVGLDSGSVTADTTYFDAGKIELSGYTISNYDGKGRGRVDMQTVLSKSLNTGVAYVVSQTGNKKFADYMRAFGLGEETGVDLPGEIPGLIENLKSPRDLEYATASFGQGIAMTPIATIRALSALANDGILVTPHVATSIEYDLGYSKKIVHDDDTRVISSEASDEITRMLVRVVDEALLGGTVSFDHYSVAAKTGTAQIADRVDGGYYDDRFLHSFFGYFPAYEPRFLVFLYTEEPKEVRYASQTLTHPFVDIVKFLINYYEVPPDR